MKVSAIVPIKLKSRRLPNKNFLMLGGKPLASYIFETLLSTPEIQEVYCYTSQPQIISLLPDGVKLLVRPSRLDGDDVKANELFDYAVKNIDTDILVIAQVPGPFITAKSISNGVNAVTSGKYDSSFSVQRVQTYCWHAGKTVNYSPNDMDQTQNLEPVYAETSGFYAFKRDDYLRTNTRINGKPFLVEVSDREAVDIDNPKDFALATQLLDFDQVLKDLPVQDSFIVNLAQTATLNEKIRHVAFDMDGVLIDSIDVMEASWDYATMSARLSIPFSDYQEHIGKSFRDILTILKVPFNLFDLITEKYEKKSTSLVESINLVDGIEVALNKIKSANVKVSIVSSKTAFRAKEIVARYFSNIQFDAIITPEDVDVGRGKPNPDQLLLACIKAGVDPHQTIYIGDMEVDRLTAERAGTHFIHAAWGYGKITTSKDIWFDSVENFSEFLINTLISQGVGNE
jgi:phosphoglycolate phosphatase-like HAD superfamily hydrolase/CMP-N-acetylneuraminic acid synthetase